MTDEITRLQNQVTSLKREVNNMRLVLERKNRELDALHFVWCDGGCPGGVHRYTKQQLTEEVVLQAEYQAIRLRKTFNSMKWKIENWPLLSSTQSDWHYRYIEALKKKIAFHSRRRNPLVGYLHRKLLVLRINRSCLRRYVLRSKAPR